MSEDTIQHPMFGIETSPGTATWTTKGRLTPYANQVLQTAIDASLQMEVTVRFDVTPEQERAYHNLSTEARLAIGAQLRAWLDAAVQAEQG